MASLDQFVEERIRSGRSYFSREDAMRALAVSAANFSAAITRLIRKGRLANPRHGFYLILRPEDQVAGAPDPVKWIDPLLKYQGLDYRISLLRAAAFHGSSHQAAMVFQLIVPKQLRDFVIGRHRLQFIYQSRALFSKINQPDQIAHIKSDEGFAKVAGIELTLLDCARYFHKAGGISGVAQIAKDIGAKANPRVLAQVARFYESSSVRRLGFLLERAKHDRQVRALERFARKAKSVLPLNPAAKPLVAALARRYEIDSRWKLVINEPVEFDD